MKILVYDVAASETGALSILNDFYREVIENDDKNQWTFIISTPELQPTQRICVRRYPWVKKSWLHRIYFELFISPKLSKEENADLILSLQNLMIPHTGIPQIVYVHQSLPFVSYKFGLFENCLFWIYQNVIGRRILKSIQNADSTIVQTLWMKQACISQAKVSKDKIKVIPPGVHLEATYKYSDSPENRRIFFYPATPAEYKNHMLILKACKELQQHGINDYVVIFTLTGQENRYAKKLSRYAKSENLHIAFQGQLSRNEVFELYSRSLLLFPSQIETFGLPLLEARATGTIILASDMPFSREILSDYSNAYFYQYNDAVILSTIMLKCIEGTIPYDQEAIFNQSERPENLVRYILNRK